jgi:NAD(P)-dependent dehydrogenase (short-subunit alcohol dehydrogenase family)
MHSKGDRIKACAFCRQGDSYMQTNHSSATQHILVLGAGELGIAVTHALAAMIKGKAGASLTVMLRSSAIESQAPEKRQVLEALKSLGVRLLAGDLIKDSVDDLSKAFGRFDVLISCIGFVAGAGTQLKITQAALGSGVKRYVPWQFGVDYDVIGKGSPQDLFDEQLEVRSLLRAQTETEWLIISTGMFTSFLFESSFGVVDLSSNTVHALGTWDTAVTVTTPEDIGYLTARILFTKPKFTNQIVFVAGDTLTYRQLADTVDKVLGRTVTRVEWSTAKLMSDLHATPENPMAKYRAVFAQGRGVAWDKNITFNAQKNIELITVEQWVREHLA